MTDMGYDEAQELLVEMSGLKHRASMQMTNIYSAGTCMELYEAMNDVGYNISFNGISFRDIHEIARMECMSRYPNISVSVKTPGSGRGYATVFEGTMAGLAEYTL
jgi:hypothetical protein